VSILTVPAASPLDGQEAWAYWAAREGRAGSNFAGAHVLLGAGAYLYWTHDGAGINPGLYESALAGLAGHEIALDPGIVDAADVATATALVVAAIDGWDATALGADVTITGPEVVTAGAGWDDAATDGAMVGMRSSTVAGAPIEGPITTVLAQHLPNPGLALPVVAVDVAIGSVANAGDRWRVALWTAAGGTTTPAGEALLVDLGQIAAAEIVADSWARIYLPADVLVTADQAMWLSLKGEIGTTTVGGRLTGDGLIGDWTAQNLQQDDGGIDPDATVAWPSTWPGTTSAQNAFVCGARLVVQRSVGDASHHSATDPAIWGVHVEPGALGSTIDFNSNLATVGLSPAIEGMRLLDIGFAVGAVRGTQPRVGVFTGGQAWDPDEPNPDGATLLADGGRLTGSSTTAWEYRSLAGVAWPASTQTAWWAKNNDDAGGTNIAFAQDPDQANASPAETPMDFAQAQSAPATVYGPEYEIFPADSAYNVTNPAVTFVSPFVAEPDDARPRNIPGARLRYYVPGIVVTPG
jgi:hypothetical protein